MSQVLIDFHISHEEFQKSIDEKDKYKQINENFENMRDANDVDTENSVLNKGKN